MSPRATKAAPDKEIVPVVERKAPESGPATFVGGCYCGAIESIPKHHQISLASPIAKGRYHQYEHTGRHIGTPPVAVYKHIQILDIQSFQ